MIFKGHNRLLLNEATVAQAIQDYLNAAMLNSDDHVEVMAVTEVTHETPTVFRVAVKSAQEKA